jgi:hypothetical protein
MLVLEMGCGGEILEALMPGSNGDTVGAGGVDFTAQQPVMVQQDQFNG